MTVDATKKTKKIKKEIKKNNDNDEEETSEGDEELDDDVDEDIIKEPLAKRTRIDPTKKTRNSEGLSSYDSEDYLKNLSLTYLKNSPTPKNTFQECFRKICNYK